MFIEVNPPMLV